MAEARAWRARLDDPASPGAFVRARIAGPSCASWGWIAVAYGAAPAGAWVSVSGRLVPAPRGVMVQGARLSDASRGALLPRLRAHAGAAIDRSFGGDAPLVRALLIADTRALPGELRDRFAAAGLVHLLSISGLHVAIIGSALQLVFIAVRLPRRAAVISALVATALYVAMIGAPAPALRSGLMLAVAECTRLGQRPTSPWATLALGAAGPLVDPRTVLDLGYQLSVVGIAGLIASRSLSTRWVAERLDGWRYTVGRELLTSVVATTVSAPLVAWAFGRVSLVGPVANLLAGPIVVVLQPALFLALLLSPMPAVAAWVAGAAHPLLLLLDAIARGAAAVPNAAPTVAPTLLVSVACALAAGALIIACVSRFPARAVIVAAAALAVAAWAPASMPAHGGAELHMIDVGQGDALALRTPRGRWVLFDAGRAWTGGDAGRASVIPYIQRHGGAVAAFVLSHPHADHVGGAASIVRALRPAGYWDAAFAAASDVYRASLEAAAATGVPWHRVHPGDSLVVDGVVVTFLAPDSSWTASLADPNEASTVVRVRYGAVRFLLVGDAEGREEGWLLSHEAGALRADVLKVGHHGSATSTTAPFLRAVRPSVALVSVGLGNSYGHPSRAVMSALAGAGATVLRTDLLGTVVVRTDGRTITVHANQASWTVAASESPHQSSSP